MSVLAIVAGVALLLAAFVFCILPPIPGPVLAYAALFTFYLTDRLGSPSSVMMAVCGVFTLIVLGLDFAMPSFGAKKFDCSKLGIWGSLVGAVVGAFFFPIGLLLGPFCGALAGELIAGKPMPRALRGAFGAFLGFVTGVALKLEWCILLTGYYLYVLFS